VFSIPQNNKSEKKSCATYSPIKWNCADQHRHARAGRDHCERCVAVGDISEREIARGAATRQLNVGLNVMFSAEHPRLERGDERVLADLA